MDPPRDCFRNFFYVMELHVTKFAAHVIHVLAGLIPNRSNRTLRLCNRPSRQANTTRGSPRTAMETASEPWTAPVRLLIRTRFFRCWYGTSLECAIFPERSQRHFRLQN